MLPEPSQNRHVWEANHLALSDHHDDICTEIPVALVYNGISHVVLMATPSNLAELVLGFSLTEGIITAPSQIYDIEINQNDSGLMANITLASSAFQGLKHRRRNMGGQSGCGLCGLESLSAIKPVIKPIKHAQTLNLSSIMMALHHFHEHQPLRRQTGAVHGVAWVHAEGQIQATFEDVGRHNALDKLIGYGAQSSTIDWSQGFILLSSRAGFEMVSKSAVMGIGCIVALSAATSYAIDLAQEANIALIGFARPDRQIIYTHHELIDTQL